jgi:hypothetical protein
LHVRAPLKLCAGECQSPHYKRFFIEQSVNGLIVQKFRVVNQVSFSIFKSFPAPKPSKKNFSSRTNHFLKYSLCWWKLYLLFFSRLFHLSFILSPNSIIFKPSNPSSKIYRFSKPFHLFRKIGRTEQQFFQKGRNVYHVISRLKPRFLVLSAASRVQLLLSQPCQLPL